MPMKTTIELSDALLDEARKVAVREGLTLRAMIERGLHRVIAESAPARPFKLRDASFRGNGLQAEFRDASWETVRNAIYHGRGA
jgi:hypothetical protein